MTTGLASLRMSSTRSGRRRQGSRTAGPGGGSIRHVSETALWVAMYRAAESERPDALFRDPYARRLAGERGAAILRGLPFGESMGWAISVRTRLIDDAVRRAVSNGARTVLNLGAGLDTRAFRLDLPASLRWFDIDLPRIIEHRRRCLGDVTARCNHVHLEADLLDRGACGQVLREVGAAGGPALAISEGLLVYLRPAQVARLARRLHDEPALRWWTTDVITPLPARLVGGLWQPTLTEAPFRFAPTDSRSFFEPTGWHETEFRSIWEESIRLQRCVPLAAWWTSLGKFALPALHEASRRMAGVVLLERT